MSKNWQSRPLSEICELVNGRAYKKDELLDSGKYPVLRVGNFFTNDHWYHSDLELSEDKYCDEGDLLYAWSASFGPRIWEGEKVIYHYHIWKVLPNELLVDKRFLFRLLEWDVDQIKQLHGTGATMIHVSKGSMESRVVPVPPIEEQREIVRIVDKTFEQIDQAIANVEANIANVRELFEDLLNSLVTDNGKGWERKKLGEVAEYFNGLTYSPKDVSDNGIVVLRSSNVQNDILDFTDIVRVNASVPDKKIVQDGDVLMCSRNGSKRLVGKTATIRNLSEKMTFGTFMMIIRSKYNDYLSWFFKSKDFRKQIAGGENTMINQITRYMLDEVTLNFPSVNEQLEIVQRLENVSIEVKKLQANYQRKLAELQNLKTAVLNEAFNGRLILDKS